MLQPEKLTKINERSSEMTVLSKVPWWRWKENNFKLKSEVKRKPELSEPITQSKLQWYCSQAVSAKQNICFVPNVCREKGKWFFMGTEKGFVGHTSGYGYHNGIYADTYITRDKNTFLLESSLESCLAVYFTLESTTFTNTNLQHWNVFLRMLERTAKKSWWEKICDLRRGMNFPPSFSLSLAVFLSLNMLLLCVSLVTKKSFSPSRFSAASSERKSYVFLLFLNFFFCRLDTLTIESRIFLRFNFSEEKNCFTIILFYWFFSLSYRFNYFTLIALLNVLQINRMEQVNRNGNEQSREFINSSYWFFLLQFPSPRHIKHSELFMGISSLL